MTISSIDESQRKAARVAGSLYVLIIVLSMLKLILVGNLIVSGNHAATTKNILANKSHFRIGVATDITMFVLVILLSVALYVILKPVNKNLALFALLTRFGEGILGGVVTVLSGSIPLLLLNGEAEFKAEQLQALVGLFLDVQSAGLFVVMIFMGLGGTVFCYLFFKAKYIPRILAAWGMLMYSIMLLLSFVNILLPKLPEMILIAFYIPGGLFEVVIGLWLLMKGLQPNRIAEPEKANA